MLNKMKQRGIVITESLIDVANKQISINADTRLSGEEVRRFLLYSDKMDYPQNSIIYNGFETYTFVSLSSSSDFSIKQK